MQLLGIVPPWFHQQPEPCLLEPVQVTLEDMYCLNHFYSSWYNKNQEMFKLH